MNLKETVNKLFAPIFKNLEKNADRYEYKPSHRYALFGIGALFGFLSIIVAWFLLTKLSTLDYGYFLPVIVFSVISLFCLVVSIFGSDRSVSGIWKSSR